MRREGESYSPSAHLVVSELFLCVGGKLANLVHKCQTVGGLWSSPPTGGGEGGELKNGNRPSVAHQNRLFPPSQSRPSYSEVSFLQRGDDGRAGSALDSGH